MIGRSINRLKSGQAGRGVLKFASRSYLLTGIRLAQLGAVAALVPVEVFGATQMVNAILLIGTSLCCGGIDTTITQDSAKTGGDHFTHLRSLAANLLTGVGVILVGYATWSLWTGRDHQFAFTLLVLGVTFRSQANQLLRAHWIGSGQINRAIRVELSLGVLSALASVAGAWFFPESVFAIALPPILILAWGWRLFCGARDLPAADLSVAEIKAERRYALVRTGNGLIPTLEIRADRALVGAFLGFADLAIFALPRRLVDQLKTLHSAASSILLPRWTKCSTAQSAAEFWTVVAVYLVVLSAGSVVLLGLAVVAIELILPPSYQASVPFLYWYLFGSLFAIPGAVLAIYSTACRQLKQEFAYRTITSAVGLSLQLLFLYQFGLIGMAYAFTVKALLVTVVTFVVCRKIVPSWRIRGGTGGLAE